MTSFARPPQPCVREAWPVLIKAPHQDAGGLAPSLASHRASQAPGPAPSPPPSPELLFLLPFSPPFPSPSLPYSRGPTQVTSRGCSQARGSCLSFPPPWCPLCRLPLLHLFLGLHPIPAAPEGRPAGASLQCGGWGCTYSMRSPGVKKCVWTGQGSAGPNLRGAAQESSAPGIPSRGGLWDLTFN